MAIKERLTAEEKAEAKAKQAERIKHEKSIARGGKIRKYKRINKTVYKPRKKRPKIDFTELARIVDNDDEFLSRVTGQGLNTLSSIVMYKQPEEQEERLYLFLNTGKIGSRTKTSLILSKEEAKLLGLKLMRLAHGHKGE